MEEGRGSSQETGQQSSGFLLNGAISSANAFIGFIGKLDEVVARLDELRQEAEEAEDRIRETRDTAMGEISDTALTERRNALSAIRLAKYVALRDIQNAQPQPSTADNEEFEENGRKYY